MADEDRKKSFWETLPGIITALAALLTGVAAVIAALNGGEKESASQPSPSPSAAQVPVVQTVPVKIPSAVDDAAQRAAEEAIRAREAEWKRKLAEVEQRAEEAERRAAAIEAARKAVEEQKLTRSATLKLGAIKVDDFTGMKLVYIPGGCFMMGSPETEEDHQDDEGPVHEVCLDGFWMGKYEVTQGQWKKIMGSNPSAFKKGDDYPVEMVSWEDAQDFIKKLNGGTGKYRLPTEAEWEYAARAGTSTARHWSDGISCDKAMYGNSETWNGSCLEYIGKRDLTQNSTAPTGSYPANQFGLHDMLGNVWEWCSDWYGEKYYASRPDKEKNPSGPESDSSRVIRGGGWSGTPGYVRAAYRRRYTPDYSDDDLGFRLVLPVQQGR